MAVSGWNGIVIKKGRPVEVCLRNSSPDPTSQDIEPVNCLPHPQQEMEGYSLGQVKK